MQIYGRFEGLRDYPRISLDFVLLVISFRILPSYSSPSNDHLGKVFLELFPSTLLGFCWIRFQG